MKTQNRLTQAANSDKLYSKFMKIGDDHSFSEFRHTVQRRKTVSVITKKWVLNTVEKLSASEIEELKHYLEYLVWKSQTPTGNLGNPKDSPKSEPTGQPTQILAALSRSHRVSIEDAEALLQSIKEGEIPIQFDSDFDESAGK